jgi:WXG100 family type VII secretion target
MGDTTGGEVRLGPDTIKVISNEVSTGRTDFTSMAKKLEGQILDKTAQWQGAGGSAFFNLHAAWMEKQTKIVNALNEFEASLGITDKTTKDNDAQQAAAHNTNLSALDGVSAKY